MLEKCSQKLLAEASHSGASCLAKRVFILTYDALSFFER